MSTETAIPITRVYARVSTEKQEEKFGLASQLSELRMPAQRHARAIQEYTDAISGGEDSRPGLTRLIADARPGDLILVHHPDRLSRGGVVHQFLIEEAILKTGATIEYVLLPRGSQGEAEWILQKTQMASFAEYEKAKIKERTTRGRNEKARQGKIPGGRVAYGLRVVEGGKVEFDTTADTVRLMYRLCVEEHRSPREIKGEFERLSMPSARGKTWRKSTIIAMLQNPIYKGEATWNTTQKKTVNGTVKQVARPEAEHIQITVPAIVSPEVWALAQERLTKNKTMLRGFPATRFYLLKGLLACHCGRKLAGEASNGRRRYRCTGRKEDGCTAKGLRAEEIEFQVWRQVQRLLMTPATVYAGFEAWQLQSGARDIEVKSQAEHLAKQVADLDRKERRLLDLYESDEGGSLEVVKARLLAVQEQKRGLRERLTRAQAQVAAQEAQAARQEAFEQFMYNTVMPAVNTDDPEEQRRVLVSLVEKIQVHADGERTIHFGFNLPAATPELPRIAKAGDPRVWSAVGYRPCRQGGEAPLRAC